MKVYVIGSSALFFWRRTISALQVLERPYVSTLDSCAHSSAELRKISIPEQLFGRPPIHLMVPSAELRFAREDYWYSVCTGGLPPSAFCSLDADVYVASPEMCLLGSIHSLSDIQVLELCMEMCGNYALLYEAERGFVSRNEPLTSKEKIAQFLDSAKGKRGAASLKRLLKYVENGSRSPMETRQYLLICLPKRMGAYGLPHPILNETISLFHAEKQYTDRHHLECDMVWPDQRVAVEYDGHDDHESRDNRARDATKRNALIAKGYTVFTITGQQICKTGVFDETVRDIARAIGFRLKGFPEDWKKRRTLLRSELFKSMSSYEIERFF